MKYFPHDPRAEFRKGLLQVLVGAAVAAAVVAGLALGGEGVSGRTYGSGLAGLVFSLCIIGMGLSTLKEARALDRERRILGERRPSPALPRVEFRSRPPGVGPRPEVLPPFPTRRMIGVSVMFAGLIGPALLGAFQVLRFGPEGALAALLLAGFSSWMLFNLVSLWKSKLWAWSAGVALFSFGLVIGAVMTAGSLMSGGFQSLPMGAATLSYFGCGLGALYSLRGKWFRHLEWRPAKDPLASVDRKAVAAALRKRATS